MLTSSTFFKGASGASIALAWVLRRPAFSELRSFGWILWFYIFKTLPSLFSVKVVLDPVLPLKTWFVSLLVMSTAASFQGETNTLLRRGTENALWFQVESTCASLLRLGAGISAIHTLGSRPCAAQMTPRAQDNCIQNAIINHNDFIGIQWPYRRM